MGTLYSDLKLRVHIIEVGPILRILTGIRIWICTLAHFVFWRLQWAKSKCHGNSTHLLEFEKMYERQKSNWSMLLKEPCCKVKEGSIKKSHTLMSFSSLNTLSPKTNVCYKVLQVLLANLTVYSAACSEIRITIEVEMLGGHIPNFSFRYDAEFFLTLSFINVEIYVQIKLVCVTSRYLMSEVSFNWQRLTSTIFFIKGTHANVFHLYLKSIT